ncbi:hypothetical protein F4604DRAFT_1878931 [Suillus subluteus]|nr:hypothetical protein F4604DRAFT_1878931 [Suillus subluteus]
MHNLFLGEFQHHCRNVWGMDVKSNETKTKISLHDTKAQAAELEKARKAIIKMSVTGLMALRKGYVVAMAIHNQVRRHPNVDIKVPGAEPTREFVLPGTEREDASRLNMLGKELVERIQSDIAKTSFPSWLVPPPRNFGSASHGKLKADQWRSVCTVSLVITLVRTWGSTSASELQRRLLSNFTDLVIAVDIATKRLDINTNNKPGEMEMTFLRYFCLATNLQTFAKTLNLPDTPQYNAMMLSFRDLFESKIHGILMDNLTPGDTSPHRMQLSKLEELEDHIYHALLHRVNLDIADVTSCFAAWNNESSLHPLLNFKAQAIHCIKVQGVTYSSFRNHPGNSFVLFRTPTAPGQSSARTAGQVQQVFMHKREPFLVVNEYRSLSPAHSHLDPFDAIEHLDAKLYYNHFTDSTHVLQLSDIVSRFSSLVYISDGIEECCIVVRSLDWICGFNKCINAKC